MRNFLAKLNLDALLKIIFLLGFALFFCLIIQNGQVLMYVHPRIVPYMKFAVIVIILMVVFILPDLWRKQKNVRCLSYLIFLLPLLTAFTLPPQAMDASGISFGATEEGTVGSGDNSGDVSISASENSGDGYSELEDQSLSAQYPSSEQEAEALETKLQMIDGRIVLNDDNFYQWSEEMFTNMNAYAGKGIEATGFIIRSEQLNENDFALARLLMTCCAADTVPIGLLCSCEQNTGLEDGSWIKINGTIKVMDYNEQTLPVIIIEKLEPTSKPDNEYVYPY